MTARPLVIGIVHPAPPRSRSGNRVTALRWAVRLRELGQRVFVERAWSGRPCDLLVAIHAIKSGPSALAFRAAHSDGRLVVAAAGTDLGPEFAAAAAEAFAVADAVVVLQPLAIAQLPPAVRDRARVIHQAVQLPRDLHTEPRLDRFEVALLANLRAVKDPLLAGRALAHVPADSGLRVLHAGADLEPAIGSAARELQRREPRYSWLGMLPHREALGLLARSHALVLTSVSEGGANVISEALALGKPVLATRIPGTVGMLGEDYPGLFEVGSQRQLADLLLRLERDVEFRRDLAVRSRALAGLVAPERERAAWASLLAELIPSATD